MMKTSLMCWKCGASLDGELLPLARRAECPACHADLHVCRLCSFYDPGVADRCREPVAEVVPDKEHANFCGYFQPRPDAHAEAGADSTRQAREQLEALFGTAPAGDSGMDTDDASAARRRLDALFGSDEKD